MPETTQTSYIIKVLSGPHQGAEVALGEGEITIGSSLESDLILSDTLIAPNHLKLHIEKGEIAITPLSQKVYVNGYLVPQDTKSINIFEYITIGSTHLVIGPNGQSWPTLTPPSLSELKDTTKEQRHTPSLQESTQDGQEPNSPSSENTSSNFTSTPPVPKSDNNKTRVPILIPIGLSFIGITVLVLLALYILFPKSNIDVSSLTLSSNQIEKARSSVIQSIESSNLSPDAFNIEIKNNQLQISGLVDTNTQKREIEKTLRKLNPHFKVNIRSQENLVVTCREVLNLLNASVVVSAVSPGVIKVTGYLPNTQIWENAKKSLLADTPGLTEVIDKVVTSKQVNDKTLPILNRYQLTQQITLTAQNNGIIAKGNLSESSRRTWYEAKIDLEKSIGNEVPLLDQVIFTSTVERIYLDARIESITITENLKWVTLQNNKTYFEGSTIPSGYTIERIAREGVTLKRGRDRITLKVGDQ